VAPHPQLRHSKVGHSQQVIGPNSHLEIPRMTLEPHLRIAKSYQKDKKNSDIVPWTIIDATLNLHFTLNTIPIPSSILQVQSNFDKREGKIRGKLPLTE
jgi:hypothetical protein